LDDGYRWASITGVNMFVFVAAGALVAACLVAGATCLFGLLGSVGPWPEHLAQLATFLVAPAPILFVAQAFRVCERQPAGS
jgi:hypothetical protein